MTLNEYQIEAAKTVCYDEKYAVVYPTLGMAGEAGEVADKVKKVLRDKDGVFSDETKTEIAKEIGDVMWYVAILSKDLGFDLEKICQMNVDKLRSRQQRDMLHGNGDNR